MTPASILAFAKRWWLVLALGPLLAGVVAYAVVGRIPPVYQATVTLLVNPRTVSATGIPDPTVAEALGRTYVEGLKTRPVLEAAAQRAGLPPTAARDLLLAESVRSITGTQLLRLSVEDRNPALAADLANDIVAVFSEQNMQMQAGRYDGSRQNLQQLVATLRGEIDARSAELQQLRATAPAGDPQLARVESEFAQLQASYSDSVRSYEDLRVAEARGLDSLTVVDPAVAPTDPARPNKAQTVALAVLAGLVVAAATALMIDYLDDGLRTPERLATKTALRALGSIPRYPAGDNGVLASQAGKGPEDRETRRAAEAYRLLFSTIMIANSDAHGGPRALMITSATMDEGKSVTAANLAGVLAETGRQVILVDADFHRPSQMRAFGLPNRRGLSTLLLSPNVSLDSVLMDTSIPGLRVLTSGPSPAASSALYTSRSLSARLAELCSSCDVLVLDTPPVLAQPDAALLGPHVDGVIFVVDARKSRGRRVRRALAVLNDAGAQVLGAALNRASPRAMDYLDYTDVQSTLRQAEESSSASNTASKPAPGGAT